MSRAWNKAWIVPVFLAALAPLAFAQEDPGVLNDEELKGLAEKALAAAVTSCGKTTYAFDDGSVVAEGGVKADQVAAAIHAGSAKAGVKLVKHADDLHAPMLFARLSTLGQGSSADHGLFLELEGADRALVHAAVTNLHKTGGTAKLQGHHTAATLDRLADRFVAKWLEKPIPMMLTILGKAQTNGVAQQSVIERITQRLLAAKAKVIAPRTGNADVERPKGVRLLGAELGLLVTLSNEADVMFVDGADLAKKTTVLRYRDPPPGAGASSPGLVSAIKRMKKLGETVEYGFRTGGYPVKTQRGKKSRAWVLEARIEQGATSDPKAGEQLTAAARSLLVGHELTKWIFEAHDGPTTSADAKAAGVSVILQPIYRATKEGRKEVLIEVRTTEDDQVIDTSASTFDEEPASK